MPGSDQALAYGVPAASGLGKPVQQENRPSTLGAVDDDIELEIT